MEYNGDYHPVHLAKISSKLHGNKENFKNFIDFTEMALQKRRPNYIALAENLTNQINTYLFFLAEHCDEKYISTEDIEKYVRLHSAVLQKLLGKKAITNRKDLDLAIFIRGLVLFGASKGQAIKAVSKWTNIGTSKLERAYKNKKHHHPTTEEMLCIVLVPCVKPIIKQFGKNDFPKSKPKKGYLCTQESFKKLSNFMDDFYEKHEWMSFHNAPFTDDITRNIWEK